jgi:uracil-DNA glycosylase
MRGTTTILRLLLGHAAGADHEGEFLSLGAESVHIFDAFALANVLLCSAVKTVEEEGTLRGIAGSPTRVMRGNCQRHFRRTLEILEPNVLVVQGRIAGRSVQSAVDDAEWLDTPLPLARLRWGQTGALAMFVSHPAAHGSQNWGQSAQQTYVEATLAPSVRAVQRLTAAAVR